MTEFVVLRKVKQVCAVGLLLLVALRVFATIVEFQGKVAEVAPEVVGQLA